MADSKMMDRTFHFILTTMVENGVAPHYTEIAKAFSIPPEEGKKLLHDLMGTSVPAWLFPDTDHIASFAPFSNLPTQYRISVEGKQKWFGQWSFDSLAACWLFPGKTITIEAPCLDCGESMRIEVRDGVIESADPPGIHTYTPISWKDRIKNLPHWWSQTNFFRSEVHARNWADFGDEGGLLTLEQSMALFSASIFRERFSGEFVTKAAEYRKEVPAILKAVTNDHPFWRPA